MKIFIALTLVVILLTLGSAAVFLIRDGSKTNNMVKALTWRIGLSVSLFLFLMFAWWMGWVEPNKRPF